jgi:hypothetical protein
MQRSPTLTPAKAAERAARDARLAKALRDNLRRRKEQAPGRPANPAGLSGGALSGKSSDRGGETAD